MDGGAGVARHGDDSERENEMSNHGTVTLNGGSNLTEKLKKIQKAISDVRQLKEERAETNADIAAVREAMSALGIPKAAFDMAMRYLEWEPEKRQGFDVAYALVREAGGLPLQGDLFMQAEVLAKDVEEKKKAAEPSAKDIADRMFEQTTRGKVKEAAASDDDEPPSAPGSVVDFAAEAERKANAE